MDPIVSELLSPLRFVIRVQCLQQYQSSLLVAFLAQQTFDLVTLTLLEGCSPRYIQCRLTVTKRFHLLL
jgi:hypothetical protein